MARIVASLIIVLLVGAAHANAETSTANALATHSATGLQAGAARASINPLEENIPTQLGGYGEREGKPATGTHDTIYAKAAVFLFDGKKSAVVSLDVCHAPRCLVEESIAKAGIEGLTYENTIMSSTHTHAGLEGMSMDKRNIANNPNLGIFDARVLEFVSGRIAKALKDADAALRPVTAGSAVEALLGMNCNRRHDGAPTDPDMTVARFDDSATGKPYIVYVNYTAHGTIMTPEIMEVSGGWPGVMQRTVEEIVGNGAMCMYSNGAEGDVAPTGYTGGSRFEMAEQYGIRAGLAAGRIAEAIATVPVNEFRVASHWVKLPKQTPSPDFMKDAGDEYKIDEKMLGLLLGILFPKEAPMYAWRVNDFGLVAFPGEPITAIGLATKQRMREAGVTHPAVASLTNDLIGYILTEDEYKQGGYEATASFYGPGLGALMMDEAAATAGMLK
jgi:neutral ceramidase